MQSLRAHRDFKHIKIRKRHPTENLEMEELLVLSKGFELLRSNSDHSDEVFY